MAQLVAPKPGLEHAQERDLDRPIILIHQLQLLRTPQKTVVNHHCVNGVNNGSECGKGYFAYYVPKQYF